MIFCDECAKEIASVICAAPDLRFLCETCMEKLWIVELIDDDYYVATERSVKDE